MEIYINKNITYTDICVIIPIELEEPSCSDFEALSLGTDYYSHTIEIRKLGGFTTGQHPFLIYTVYSTDQHHVENLTGCVNTTAITSQTADELNNTKFTVGTHVRHLNVDDSGTIEDPGKLYYNECPILEETSTTTVLEQTTATTTPVFEQTNTTTVSESTRTTTALEDLEIDIDIEPDLESKLLETYSRVFVHGLLANANLLEAFSDDFWELTGSRRRSVNTLSVSASVLDIVLQGEFCVALFGCVANCDSFPSNYSLIERNDTTCMSVITPTYNNVSDYQCFSSLVENIQITLTNSTCNFTSTHQNLTLAILQPTTTLQNVATTTAKASSKDDDNMVLIIGLSIGGGFIVLTIGVLLLNYMSRPATSEETQRLTAKY